MRDDVGEDQHSSIGDTQHDTRADNQDSGDTAGGGEDGVDDIVNIDYYIKRYRETLGHRLKSIDDYLRTVDRFERDMGISKYTRRQLKSKGKDIVVQWFTEHVPRRSWTPRLSHLRSFWTYGMRMEWPVDVKRDLPKIPRTKPRETPPDEIVKDWTEALEHEPNLLFRLYWYGIAEHGWRPSHLCHLEWSHVRWRDGDPWAVVAQSENFKTQAPLITVLGPHFRKNLKAWRKENVDDRYVFPKLVKLARPSMGIWRKWKTIEKRYSLPSLTPNSMRHWASTAGHRIGLSKQALAGMLGHDGSGGSMADWYDNRSATAILEEQETKLGGGLLTLVVPPKVEIVEENKEILSLWSQYMSRDLSTMEFASEAERIRNENLMFENIRQ